MIHGSIEQWGNLNGTDIQQTSCQSNQSIQIEIHVDQNVIFFQKKGNGMYKYTRKLQLHEKN